MAIYRDTGVFYLSITGTDNFQYRPLLYYTYVTQHEKTTKYPYSPLLFTILKMCKLHEILYEKLNE